MTNGSLPQDRRLSKFSNADRGSYTPSVETLSDTPTLPNEQPAPPDLALSDMIEHVIRDGGVSVEPVAPEGEPAPRRSYTNIDLRSIHSRAVPEADTLPNKLIEELHAAHEQTWVAPEPEPQPQPYQAETAQPIYVEAYEPPANLYAQATATQAYRMPQDEPVQAATALVVVPPAQQDKVNLAGVAKNVGLSTLSGLGTATAWTSRHVKRSAVVAASGATKFTRANRLADWHRRYFNSVTLVHRRLFDTKIERLLFIKTAQAQTKAVSEGHPEHGKVFTYKGPLPRLALEWVFAALPADLKRFAFVDFRAGNGRTLLLATRQNFEYAVGYAFDQQGCDELEMNLSQYPRSYMTCRDVRAIRGDLEGVVIPPQPVVLFFPATIRDTHLSIILSHASASYRLNRRPMFLIFEHVDRDYKIEYEDIFKQLTIPVARRLKSTLLSPARMAVYYSSETAAQS